MGSAIAKTLTANACEAGLAGLQRADIEQRRAPQATLGKLLSIYCTYAPQAAVTDETLGL